LELADLLVGPRPLVDGGIALDPLDQNAAVPGAVEDRHSAPARQCRSEAQQELVALLVGCRGGESRDADVTQIERSDEALDRSSLAGRVPALEQNADRGPQTTVLELAPELETQGEQPSLRSRDAFLPLST